MSSYEHRGSLAQFEKISIKERSTVKPEKQYLIEGSSSSQSSNLAVLDRSPQEKRDNAADEIKFLGMTPSEEIFKKPTLDLEQKQRSKVQFTWGVEDKIYWATEKTIEVVQYKSAKNQRYLKPVKVEDLTLAKLDDLDRQLLLGVLNSWGALRSPLQWTLLISPCFSYERGDSYSASLSEQ